MGYKNEIINDESSDNKERNYYDILCDLTDKIDPLLNCIENDLDLIKEKNDKNTYILILTMHHKIENFLMMFICSDFLSENKQTYYELLEKLIEDNDINIKELKKVDFENRNTIINMFEYIEQKTKCLKKLADEINNPQINKPEENKKRIKKLLCDLEGDGLDFQTDMWTKLL